MTMQATSGRILSRIEYVTDTLAILAMFACMVVISIEVFCRYALNSPQSWVTDVLVIYLLPTLFFMGLPGSYTRGSHVAVDILCHYASPRKQLVMSIIGRIIAVAVFFAITFYGVGRVTEAVRLGEIQPGMLANWPIWPSVLVVPVGCALSMARACERLVAEIVALCTDEDAVRRAVGQDDRQQEPAT